MKYKYPYLAHNIPSLLKWFDKEKKKATGEGLAPSKFPICGGNISNFIKKNNITIDEFKTLLWGIMNIEDNVYSPIYATYRLEDLEKCKKLKEKYEENENKEKNVNEEISFNSQPVINEENNKEEGFFDEL